jgi:hypothetical protein
LREGEREGREGGREGGRKWLSSSLVPLFTLVPNNVSVGKTLVTSLSLTLFLLSTFLSLSPSHSLSLSLSLTWAWADELSFTVAVSDIRPLGTKELSRMRVND